MSDAAFFVNLSLITVLNLALFATSGSPFSFILALFYGARTILAGYVIVSDWSAP